MPQFAMLWNWTRRFSPSAAPSRADAQIVAAIQHRAASLAELDPTELAKRVRQLRAEVASGTDPLHESVAVPMLALVCEAARRALGIKLYDVQILAGLLLARGQIAQMQTGEGKTYSAALPAALHALTGRGVHVMTANSYLAERDCQLLRPLFGLLGITTGLLGDGADQPAQIAAYACDVTYGNGCQFAFDYLRDQIARQERSRRPLGESLRQELRTHPVQDDAMQRGLAWAIIDEADNVLIDDAGSPLVISDRAPGPAPDAAAYRAAKELSGCLVAGSDYEIQRGSGQFQLTATGKRRIYQDATRIPEQVLTRPWSHYVEQALRAAHQFRRDVHYIVSEGEVQIVDATTGRIFADRTWQAGLHQAIAAKEGLEVMAETQPLAQITRQRFFRLYENLCGMTGTALGAQRELAQFYRLPVVDVPLRKSSQRMLLPTRYFASSDAKWSGLVNEVARLHALGRPILLGTQSIAESEELAVRLGAQGLPHRVLDGRQDAEEAGIVSAAGQLGAITVATNVAGRGTDIHLPPEVVARGGLHVIASGRHEAGRIDRQLVGRCARQGQPGSAQFFVSAEDVLIQRYAPWLARAMRRLANSDGEITCDLDAKVRRVQRRAEKTDFARRRELFRYDRYRSQVLKRFAGEKPACNAR